MEQSRAPQWLTENTLCSEFQLNSIQLQFKMLHDQIGHNVVYG